MFGQYGTKDGKLPPVREEGITVGKNPPPKEQLVIFVMYRGFLSQRGSVSMLKLVALEYKLTISYKLERLPSYIL